MKEVDALLVPVRDFLLVEPLPVEERSAGGIVLPEASRGGALRGKVVAVGEGRWSSALGRFFGLSAGKGDVVLFLENSGFEVSVEGREYRMVRDADLVGVFREE